MMTNLLLPLPDGVEIEEITTSGEDLIVSISSVRARMPCPQCLTFSQRVHSRYFRLVADTSCGARCVTLRLAVRKFVCGCETCPQRIFAERFPGLVRCYARQTDRLQVALHALAEMCGGRPAARLSTRLQMPTQRQTLLRSFMRLPPFPPAFVRVLGVDDWSWAKGQRYGTILVDLERHRTIGLLPNRQVDTVIRWLEQHPEIEVISRDRGMVYIDGATRGAPQAVQVADRFHLLMNMRETVEAVVKRHRVSLSVSHPAQNPPSAALLVSQERLARLAQRMAQFEHVKQWHEEGVSRQEIANRTGMSIRNITRYLRLQQCPQYGRQRKSTLDPYVAYLRQRFADGCLNAMHLFHDVQAQGYTGTYPVVAAYIRCLKSPEAFLPHTPATLEQRTTYRPRVVTWWMMKATDDLTPAEQEALSQILTNQPDLALAAHLAARFQHMVRERLRDRLEPWLQDAETSALPEFRRFAWGIRQDEAAVTAALCEPWSNGPVEGQVNRLKTIKRQMYGRAGLPLLEQRVRLSS